MKNSKRNPIKSLSNKQKIDVLVKALHSVVDTAEARSADEGYCVDIHWYVVRPNAIDEAKSALRTIAAIA